MPPLRSQLARVAVTAFVALVPLACWPGADDFDDFDIDFCEGVSAARVTPAATELRPADTLHMKVDALRNGEPVLLCGGGSGWSSSNMSVATVTAEGIVTGVGGGTAWIRASVEGFRDSARVTVSTVPIASLTIDSASATLRVWQVMPLALTARDAAGAVLPVRRGVWRSTNTAVATVTPGGNVVAVAPGTVSIEVAVEGRTATVDLTTSRDVPAVTFQQVSAGSRHSCALVSGEGRAPGTAYCWGNGMFGQLGNGATASHAAPQRVSGALTFASIAAGGDHACGATDAGAVYCWGSNAFGQIGDGTAVSRTTPTRVPTSIALRGVATSSSSSCALAADGQAHCWGTWATRARVAPAVLPGGRVFTQLAGGSGMICGLTAEGAVHCWGNFNDRQLAVPTLVSGEVAFRSVAIGFLTLCGVGVDRQLYCWGANAGPLWDPAIVRREVPGLMAGGSDFEAVATTGNATCAVTTVSALWCLRTLGVSGTVADAYALRPLSFGAERPFARLAAGDGHFCAIDIGGGGWCWGRNDELQTGVPHDVAGGRVKQLRVR